MARCLGLRSFMSVSPSDRAGRFVAGLLSFAPFMPAAQAQDLTVAVLDPVVVAATRTPQPRSTVLADVSVIEREEIERSGATGLADVLARLPGIQFVRNGGPGASTAVYLRGGEKRHTAVYLDGVRVDSQSDGGAVWEQIPLEQIDRIEVLRGPAAAFYGSDAIAGVVQLFTRRGQGSARPSVALTLGSHRTVLGQAGVSGSTGTLDYALSASHGRSDGFDAQTAADPGHNPDEDGWRRSAVHARLGLQVDAVHRVEATLLASRLQSGFDGYTPGLDDQNHHALRNASLAWQGRWNADATTRLQMGQTKSTYETQPSFYRTETRLRDLTLQHEQRLGTQHLSATLERREDDLYNPATAFGDALSGSRHQDGLSLGWRGDFRAHGLQAQLRHDQDSEFGGKSTGSLAWGWTFVPDWRFSASAGTSFRVPTLYQRFSQYGNAALVPESGRNVELGLRWAARGDEASLTAWRNRVTNLIDFGDPGPCIDSYGCYVNAGRARLQGVTLAGRMALGTLALHGSLDWHDPRNLDTDHRLPRRAKQLATLGADAELGRWTVGGEVQAVGRRWDDAANTRALGGYALLNLVVSTPVAPGLLLQARVDNLGDKAYETASTYATGGRNLQLTLRWTMP